MMGLLLIRRKTEVKGVTEMRAIAAVTVLVAVTFFPPAYAGEMDKISPKILSNYNIILHLINDPEYDRRNRRDCQHEERRRPSHVAESFPHGIFPHQRSEGDGEVEAQHA